MEAGIDVRLGGGWSGSRPLPLWEGDPQYHLDMSDMSVIKAWVEGSGGDGGDTKRLGAGMSATEFTGV